MNVGETTALGRTALRVTRMGLGSAPLGNLYSEVSDEHARQVVELAYERGIRFFDTAPLYGYGLAENRVGAVLSSRPRETFVLATKVGRLLQPGREPDPSQFFDGEPFYKATPSVAPVFDFSHDGVMRSLQDSLERLHLDRVDILHIHDPDDHHDEAITGAFRALADLRSEGVIGAVGSGMNQAEMLVRFALEADFDCFLLAGRYTLLDQSGLRELLPLCQSKGIAIIIGGVFNSGLLADPKPGSRFNYVPASPDVIERARRISAVCDNHLVSMKAAAMRFPFGHPSVASVLVGCRSVAELEENIDAFQADVPGDLWRELKAEGLLADEVPTP
jgi:D-threo-aldose 1-dehydrogenase